MTIVMKRQRQETTKKEKKFMKKFEEGGLLLCARDTGLRCTLITRKIGNGEAGSVFGLNGFGISLFSSSFFLL